jgi:uncharacterized membrane protein
MFPAGEEKAERGKSRWRRLLDYSLGIIIESAAVGVIVGVAIGIMYLVKILVK